MASTLPRRKSLIHLLDTSSRPAYAVDAQRRIAYSNPALSAWLGLATEQIVGRYVEYHSEPAAERGGQSTESAALLTDLCPPPRALSGEACDGTISCMGRDGRLTYRRAQFVPLGTEYPCGVLVLLATHDLPPQDLAAQVSGEPSADDLHRMIRRFRRAEAARYAPEALLGESASMRKVRDQVFAATESGANTLICGRRGTGRGHIARTIHYRSAGDADVKIIPVDCDVATDELLRPRNRVHQPISV